MVEFLPTLLRILGLMLSGRETQGGTEGGTDKETAGRCLVSVSRKMLLFKGLNQALGDLTDVLFVYQLHVEIACRSVYSSVQSICIKRN